MLLYLVVIPTVAGSFITLLLAIYAWRHHYIKGAAAFVGMMLGLTIWLVARGLLYLSADETFMFFNRIISLGITTAPVFLFIFAIQRNGYDQWLSRRRIAAFFSSETVPSSRISKVLLSYKLWQHSLREYYWYPFQKALNL